MSSNCRNNGHEMDGEVRGNEPAPETDPVEAGPDRKASKAQPSKENQPHEIEGEVVNEADRSIERNIFEVDGCYFKKTGGRKAHLVIVSNMILRAKAKVVSDGDWFYLCAGIRYTGEEHEIKLYRSDFLSGASFKRALSAHSGFEFYGNNYDTTHIQGLLADQKPSVIKGTDRNGIHILNGRLVYLEGDGAVDRNGPVSDIVSTNRKSQASRIPALLRQPDISEDALEDALKAIAENLNKFNHPSITYPVLGFIGYCFVKEAITQKVEYRNPFLLCWGEPGSGKSLTISRVIMPIFDIRQPFVNIGSVSEYALALNSSNSNMTPVCYDEFKHAVLTRSQKRTIDRVLLATYAQTGLQRGRPNKMIDDLQMTAPLVLAGEVTMDSASLNHRKIEVLFSYGKRKGTTDSFQQLIRQPLGEFGKGLLHHVLKLGASKLGQAYDEQESLVDSGIGDRFRDNAALMRTGLWLITDFLESHGIGADGYGEGFDMIDAGIMDAVNKAKITNVEKTIADFCTMADLGKLVNLEDYQVKGDNLSLKIASVYAKYERWSKRNGTSEFIGKRSFLQQVADKEYFVGKGTMRIGGQSCNAIKLDLTSLPEGLDINWPGYQRVRLSKSASNGKG